MVAVRVFGVPAKGRPSELEPDLDPTDSVFAFALAKRQKGPIVGGHASQMAAGCSRAGQTSDGQPARVRQLREPHHVSKATTMIINHRQLFSNK